MPLEEYLRGKVVYSLTLSAEQRLEKEESTWLAGARQGRNGAVEPEKLLLLELQSDSAEFSAEKPRYALWYVNPPALRMQRFFRGQEGKLTGEQYTELFKDLERKRIGQRGTWSYDELTTFLETYNKTATDSAPAEAAGPVLSIDS